MTEEWREIPGYEGCYEVSNFGRVRSLDKTVGAKNGSVARKHGKVRKLSVIRKGYLCVRLCDGNKPRNYQVHRLVADAFIPNPDNLPCINHKDNNPQNNYVENLEWCTYEYNNHYGDRIAKMSASRMENEEGKPVLQYTKDGTLIKRYANCYSVSREWGRNVTAHIHACASHKQNRKTAYGYIWRFEGDVCA